MGERWEELKGNVKEGAGGLTGDRSMEVEGAMQSEGARAERHFEGGVDRVTGGLKEGAGDLTGDRSLEAEGEADQRRGEARQIG